MPTHLFVTMRHLRCDTGNVVTLSDAGGIILSLRCEI